MPVGLRGDAAVPLTREKTLYLVETIANLKHRRSSLVTSKT